jgi:hypothetical protein
MEQIFETVAVGQETETDNVVVVNEGVEYKRSLAQYGLNFDSLEADIKNAVQRDLREQFDINLANYKVKKTVNTRTVYIFPNSTAG